uniref:outer membrane protein assembly factor BamB family protein n=1 Tax=Cephaloticoccus sp. TaxID=1985742 RepID=UPI004049BBF1
MGYSDEQGLAIGWPKLLAQLAPVAPRFFDVNATALPMADFMAEAIRSADFPPYDWMLPADNNSTFKGYLGYLEGDAGLMAQYQEVWRKILTYGIPEGDHNIKDLHLRMSLLISAFRMFETVGLIEEELRASILEYFIKWINSDQGVSHLSFEGTVVPGIQRQNHGTIPALGLSYFASYLRDFYPDITTEPTLWEKLADKVFSVYWEGSWKPASEGLCHGWYLEQPVLLEYGLLDPLHRFFKNGGARRAADCAMAVVNNFGWMPASGDAHLLRSYPSDSLRTAAAWYRNEEYRFVDLMAPDYRRLRSHVFMLRAFDIGVKGKRPPSGLTVVPLDPLVHGAHDKAPKAAPWMFKVPPSAPVESCFDKVAFRNGWDHDDAYLLIDGIGGGSHAYDDALDLIEYSRLGYSFLVSDSGVQSPEPDNHSIVTVARDGLCAPTPCFGECDAATWDEAKQHGYARLSLRGNNGSTWTRELFFLGEQGMVIHDHVTAEREGDFTIQCNLRIPGKVEHDSGQTIARRQNAAGEEVVFTLQSVISDQASLELVEDDKRGQIRQVEGRKNPPLDDDLVEAWWRRYGTKDIQISIVRSRIHAHLQAGEGVSFVHYAHAHRGSEAEMSLRVEGRRGLVLTGGPTDISLQSHFDLELQVGDSLLVKPSQAEVGCAQNVISDLNGEIKKIIPLISGGVVVVSTGGQIAEYDTTWNRRWETAITGTIHDADADGALLYVGHAARSLSALSLQDGGILWTTEFERIPSSCPWWEWYSTAALRVVAARPQSGFEGVIIGCGDMHVRAFAPNGESRWVFRYQNGIPGTIGLMDVNDDGVDEIMVGGEVMSNRAECRLLRADGSLLQEVEVEWWTSRMTAQARSEEHGKWAAFGANWGRNLHLIEMQPTQDEPLHKRWLKYLPGSTTALLIDAPHQRLLVGNSMGLFYCFNFAGDQLGRVAFPTEISAIMRLGEGFLVGLTIGQAHWLRLKDSGSIGVIEPWKSSGDWAKAIALKEAILVPTSAGLALHTLSS